MARAQTAATLAHWQLPELVDDAPLVIGALVANAVHASTAALGNGELSAVNAWYLGWLAIRLSDTGRHVVIEVFDSAPGTPALRDTDPLVPGGHGLHLVEARATTWGYYPVATGPGKVVHAAFSHAGAPPNGAHRPVPLPRRAPTVHRDAGLESDAVLLHRVRDGLRSLPAEPPEPVPMDARTALSLFRRPADGDPQP
ncbi:ATP-binding protein [Pseudofrankia asymbiotica]|uniref:ATP-binding protein n=1 Tax=Pseudofrankia asymbiotica TaxID=1834516 RepID=UPI0010558C50|nr:ATP-binding protein [Pseudofrankia asymbiotica]